jgi:mono/diheme cytochrome c family protein
MDLMRRSVLRVAVVALLVAVAIGATAFWVLTIPARVDASELAPHRPDLENGRTMFLAGGCASCHAPDQEERTRLAGGVALKSPFGTFYSPNISPDSANGIGNWTEAEFVTAMSKGTSPEGRHYYPAFPYTSYQRMQEADLRDLFAYLKTLPAVPGRARDHDLPLPLRMRRGLGLWKLLFLDGRRFAPDPARSQQWNRGAYLVNGPGHCAECHSPRNLLGGIIGAERFAGGPDPESDDGRIPNITQAGIGDYSEGDIAQVLESGDLPDGDSVGGRMRAVVRNTSELSSQDRASMAVYIKSLPPVQGTKHPRESRAGAAQ